MAKHGLLLVAAAAGALMSTPEAGLAQSTEVPGKPSPNAEFQGDIAVTYLAKSATLKVPGAQIYYEVQGAGPLLLMIPGGPADAGVFDDLSRHLADRYTVMAYDPRGNSRSTFDGPPEDLQLDVQADDAAALIRALGDGPAYVFGNSGGAQIGLNLAARYPELVRVLVAHEPPSMMLLDDPSEAVADSQGLYDAYQHEGADAAMAKFFADNGLEDVPEQAEAPPEIAMPPEAAATMARVSGNFEYWLANGVMPLSLCRPDVDALRAGRPRVVVAIGEQSQGLPIERMGMALARELGAVPAPFPGDHMGFASQADDFAEALHQALGGQ